MLCIPRKLLLGNYTRHSAWPDIVHGKDPDAPLLTGKFDRPLSKNALRLLISRLGEKAGVEKCHPHRFRHTFAITYLHAGGDLSTLQALLGHSSLEMVRYYAQIAETAVQQAQRRANPADNWRL
jgi:integrase/recombinase XerD